MKNAWAVYRHDPRPLAENACPTCHRPIGINPSGRRRKHRFAGEVCTGSGVMVGAQLPHIDPELLNEALTGTAPQQRMPGDRVRVEADGRYKPVKGYCYECERPVTGERRFCGPCLAARDRRA